MGSGREFDEVPKMELPVLVHRQFVPAFLWRRKSSRSPPKKIQSQRVKRVLNWILVALFGPVECDGHFSRILRCRQNLTPASRPRQ